MYAKPSPCLTRRIPGSASQTYTSPPACAMSAASGIGSDVASWLARTLESSIGALPGRILRDEGRTSRWGAAQRPGDLALRFACRLDRLRKLVHRGRVQPASVVARQHVEIVERNPVARALGAIGGLLEQQQSHRIVDGPDRRIGDAHAIGRPRIGRAALREPAIELAQDRIALVVGNRCLEQY